MDDTPEIDSKSEDNFGMQDNLSGKAEDDYKADIMMNRDIDVADSLSCNSESLLK